MGAVNGCCTTPVNVIKIKINYSCFFRDIEKAGYVLVVCQFRWGKSNHFATGPKCPWTQNWKACFLSLNYPQPYYELPNLSPLYNHKIHTENIEKVIATSEYG